MQRSGWNVRFQLRYQLRPACKAALGADQNNNWRRTRIGDDLGRRTIDAMTAAQRDMPAGCRFPDGHDRIAGFGSQAATVLRWRNQPIVSSLERRPLVQIGHEPPRSCLRCTAALSFSARMRIGGGDCANHSFDSRASLGSDYFDRNSRRCADAGITPLPALRKSAFARQRVKRLRAFFIAASPIGCALASYTVMRHWPEGQQNQTS